MIKDFENSSEIDLDTSNIKNNPIKIYDYVDYIWPHDRVGGVDNLEKELNIFVGVSPEHKCVFHFNIREYMKLEPTEKEKTICNNEKIKPRNGQNFYGV